MKEIAWEESIEEKAPKEKASGTRKSSRVKTPIKRLMNEQTLYHEARGPKRKGKCFKLSKDILQE